MYKNAIHKTFIPQTTRVAQLQLQFQFEPYAFWCFATKSLQNYFILMHGSWLMSNVHILNEVNRKFNIKTTMRLEWPKGNANNECIRNILQMTI